MVLSARSATPARGLPSAHIGLGTTAVTLAVISISPSVPALSWSGVKSRCTSGSTACTCSLPPARASPVCSLAKEIGVTQKTAWFVLGRLREACGGPDGPLDKLRGEVEIDECFVGGLEANKHEDKKLNAGRGAVGKVAVLGMRERGGRTHAMVIPDTTINTIQNEIHGQVEAGSQLYTDEHAAYNDLDGLFFSHDAVNHGAGEYGRGRVHTNGIESVWAVLKRGLHGVYHHASKKHLARYVDEFTFRLNDGNVANHTTKRLDSFVDATVGKRLTYKRLIA